MTTTEHEHGEETTEKDWRSERERNGWCRCGKREDAASPGCEWHKARAEVTAPELSADEKAEVARFGIHDKSPGLPEIRVERAAIDRVKVACINWGHKNAPHAMSYVLRNNELVAEAFHDTWAQAMERANLIAVRLGRRS